MKKTNLRKLLPKIALLIAVVIIMTTVLAGCGSRTVIDTSKKAADWKDVTVNLNPDKDFLDTLLSYVGVFLSWITKIMPANSYILTLFVFAIIMEIVLFPFSIKQQKNSIKQAKLRPKEMAIRRRYAGRNDQATQQKVTQEIQELYQKENFNPMGGCLPLLIQLPIILVLYWLVVDPLQYVMRMSGELADVLHCFITTPVADGGLGLALKSANGSIEIISKINDLGVGAFEGIKSFCANGTEVYEAIEAIYENSPNFNIGPVNFGITPVFDFTSVNAWLLLVPVLTFVAYYFSMKINKKFMAQPTQNPDDRQAACSNKMMDVTMPLMSVFITFGVPAAVGVYWIFKSIVGVLKQFVLSKIMPLPKFTEEDYKAAEREMYGKQPKKIAKSENAGKVRSLHHIDDEDYDEKGNYVPKKTEETPKAEEKQELPKNNMTEGATLKDESDKK